MHYENTHYTVSQSNLSHDPVVIMGGTYKSFYVVTNRATGIEELYTPSLTEAILYAASAGHQLTTKPWEWLDKAESVHEDHLSSLAKELN